MTAGGSEADELRMNRSRPAAMTSLNRGARSSSAWCMVGTAVYQVGCIVPQPGEEAEAAEARSTDHRPAGGDRGQHCRDQPVNVEQRHDVQADIRRPQLQRPADMHRRGSQIGVRQRHDFRPGSGAGGVQHKGDVIGPRRAAAGSGMAGHALRRDEDEGPGGRRIRDQFDDRDPLLRRHRPCRRVRPC